MLGRDVADKFNAGTLAGAGCFRCEECGFAVALHERDEVPGCPHCGGKEFKRSSIFGDLTVSEPVGPHHVDRPAWLAEARAEIDRDGDFLAYDDGGSLRLVEVPAGWTRVGRSLSAEIRFDDPTVSRRHALLHSQDGEARILDDRSLNGVFVGGERIEMHELRDGDQVTIGRFNLHFMTMNGATARPRHGAPEAIA
jgi:predicted  nucleic acid-binding Zn-ribbon protein